MELTARHDDTSIELEGNSENLRQFAQAVRDAGITRVYRLQLPSAPAAPYAGYLTSLRLEPSSGNVCLSLRNNQLIVQGARERLATFADNVEFLSNSAGPVRFGACADHLHIEYYPGHFYLDEKSIPLVVIKRPV
jgi:hypothetical protein